MGQQLYNPPTVEGWHTGKEWIDGGALNERVDFAVREMANPSAPGIQEVITDLRKDDEPLSPERFVEKSLDILGSLEVSSKTYAALLDCAKVSGGLDFNSEESINHGPESVHRMLQIIAASPEYQFA